MFAPADQGKVGSSQRNLTATGRPSRSIRQATDVLGLRSNNRTYCLFRDDITILLETDEVRARRDVGTDAWEEEILFAAWMHPAVNAVRGTSTQWTQIQRSSLDLICQDVLKKRRDMRVKIGKDSQRPV